MKTAYRQYPLHAQFHNRNLRAFRQILEATRSAPATAPTDGIVLGRTPGTGSGPRSWQNSWGQSSIHAHLAAGGAASVVNGRDSHGRTILHCICSSTDPTALDYLHAVLAHPYVDVNLRDLESGWTALHRALWCGNLSAAMMLMARTDLKLELRDNEGYTAFDLYNSTVEGTTPPLIVHGAGLATAKGRDLFMWGTSRFVIGIPLQSQGSSTLTKSIGSCHSHLQRMVPAESNPNASTWSTRRHLSVPNA